MTAPREPRTPGTMRKGSSLALVGLACVLAGCASGGASAGTQGEGPVTRWIANLQPTQARTGSAVVTDRQKAYGVVELTRSRQRDTRMRARIDVTAPAAPGVSALRWSIAQGSCGSGTPPLIPAESFPMIEVSTNGKGALDVEVPIDMPSPASYHVNIFDGRGTQLSNVLTCGNLRAMR